MGQNCQDTIEMSLESVKLADTIIYCDGGSTDNTLNLFSKWKNNYVNCPNIKLIENKYDQEDKGMNGKQRNFYLKYLKENYLNNWCLCLDADEVLEDQGIEKLRFLISNIKEVKYYLLSPRIHHFIGDLGHEDSTKDQHFVPNRFFKIKEELIYPEVEHTVLSVQTNNLKEIVSGGIDVHIWHFRECLGVFASEKKHENNQLKSNIHNQGYLDWWHRAMLFGYYPKKPVYYGEIPNTIKQRFQI